MHKQKHPVETKAREKLSNAVRDKKIERPNRCQHCGKDTRLHGHHHDYSKPLSVIWLCVPCHRQIHAFMDLINKANKEHEQKAS
jgi:DNA-directed RNA polymerase subunit RPC12/RpoP